MGVRKATSTGPGRRARWIRVRVVTEDGGYVGKVKLEGGSRSLSDLVGDGRAYLGVWSAIHESSGREEDFIALHKASVRYVVQLSEGAATAAPAEA